MARTRRAMWQSSFVVAAVLAVGVQAAWGQTGPVITGQPQRAVVQLGQTASFTVTASGTGTLSYQWRKDGVNLANGGRISWTQEASSSTLTISGIGRQDIGRYDVTITDASDSATSTSARLCVSGFVYATGLNSYGQLGTDDINKRLRAVPTLIDGVIQVAGGWSHSLALKGDGTVWAWGGNNGGQLGSDNSNNSDIPVQVPNMTGVAAVAAGSLHSLALKDDGTIWAWGSNSYGQLGNGTVWDDYGRAQVPNLTGVVAMAAGTGHNLALKDDGAVWAWGFNNWGVLGDGTTTWHPNPVQVPGLADVLAVAVGSSHSLALKSDGTVWAWGKNLFGAVGDGTTTDHHSPVQVSGLADVIAVAAANRHSLAIKSDGTVWAWGYNGNGELGDGTTTQRNSPVQVTGLSGVVAVAAGGDSEASHCLAVKSDGTVWGWGRNWYGQLGDGTTGYKNDRLTPVQVPGVIDVLSVGVGSNHTLFLARQSTGPLLADVWPANNTREREVQSIVVYFDRIVANVSVDDLTLSSGTVLGVQCNESRGYAFTVTGLMAGTVTATISGDIAAQDGAMLSPFEWTFQILCPGDINGDGYVNVGDLQALVAAWGSQKTPPSSNWDEATDVNGDGYVNVGDLQILVANWGRSLN